MRRLSLVVPILWILSGALLPTTLGKRKLDRLIEDMILLKQPSSSTKKGGRRKKFKSQTVVTISTEECLGSGGISSFYQIRLKKKGNASPVVSRFPDEDFQEGEDFAEGDSSSSFTPYEELKDETQLQIFDPTGIPALELLSSFLCFAFFLDFQLYSLSPIFAPTNIKEFYENLQKGLLEEEIESHFSQWKSANLALFKGLTAARLNPDFVLLGSASWSASQFKVLNDLSYTWYYNGKVFAELLSRSSQNANSSHQVLSTWLAAFVHRLSATGTETGSMLPSTKESEGLRKKLFTEKPESISEKAVEKLSQIYSWLKSASLNKSKKNKKRNVKRVLKSIFQKKKKSL